jgi:hypothetical protein
MKLYTKIDKFDFHDPALKDKFYWHDFAHEDTVNRDDAALRDNFTSMMPHTKMRLTSCRFTCRRFLIKQK